MKYIGIDIWLYSSFKRTCIYIKFLNIFFEKGIILFEFMFIYL